MARCLLAFLLALICIGCGGRGDGPASPRSLGKGRLVGEEQIEGRALSLPDMVVDHLETKNSMPGASDTGAAGLDAWELRVDEPRRIAIGVEAEGLLGMRLETTSGSLIAEVKSGEPITMVDISPGILRVVTENLGNQSRDLWVGWRASNQTRAASSPPGIYVNETPPPNTSLVGTPTSVPLILGKFGAPFFQPTLVASAFDVSASFPLGPVNASSVELGMFFLNGGGLAKLVSMPDSTLASHQQAITVAGGELGSQNQIVMAPEMTTLSVAEWGSVAKALSEIIDKRAMLVLEPPAGNRTPDDVTSLRASLAGLTNARRVAMYFPWLLDSDNKPIPPAGAVVGLWTQNDESRGVWVAPAGVDLQFTGISGVEYYITDSDEGFYNAPLDGLAINAIRDLIGYGIRIWGSRTMAGNDAMVRYVPTNRELIYLEQSLQELLLPFVFLPNDPQTWAAAVRICTSFLTGLWQEGGLVGETANSAFAVQCGLGSTMTAQDILNGYMVVTVQVALIYPAEFYTLVFKQQLQVN